MNNKVPKSPPPFPQFNDWYLQMLTLGDKLWKKRKKENIIGFEFSMSKD